MPFDAVDRATWSTAGTQLDVAQIQPVLDMAAKYGTIPKTFAAREMVSAIGLSPK